MADKFNAGFVRDEQGRLVLSTGGKEGWISGFVRDEEGRLVVIGPEGQAIGGLTPEEKAEFQKKAESATVDTTGSGLNTTVEKGNEHVASSLLLKSLLPTFSVLSADTAGVKNSATLTPISESFAIPISASATEQWLIDGFLIVEGGGTEGDLKLAFNVPSGATGWWGAHANGTSLPGFAAVGVGQTPGAIRTSLSENLTYGTIAGKIGILFTAFVQSGGTAGNVVPTYAQATAKETETVKVLKTSLLRAQKVAS